MREEMTVTALLFPSAIIVVLANLAIDLVQCGHEWNSIVELQHTMGEDDQEPAK